MLLPATWMPGGSAQDLRATPHNLARHGGAAAAAPADAGELCVFCHAPTVHDAKGAAPLWQRSIDASHAFGLYDDVGMDTRGRVGSHSVACLSCHDANQAPTAGVTTVPGTRDPEAARQPDHPVGVPYRGALRGASDPRSDFRPAVSALLDGKPVWWVPSGVPGATRRRTDLPLFSRSGAEGENVAALIECGTCHDPHTATQQFLRLSAQGSQLCLTCHDK